MIPEKEYVYFEGMTSINAVLRSVRNGAERKVTRILYDPERREKKKKELTFLNSVSGEFGFRVEECPADTLRSYVSGTTHGGIIAECTRRTRPALNAGNISDNGFYIYIEGVEDPFNLGYSIRSAYALGTDGLIFSGGHIISSEGIICRSSAGASELAEIFLSPCEEAIGIFRSKGYQILTASIRDSVSLSEADLSRPTLVIIGGEKRGLTSAVLDRSDANIRIEYANSDFRGSLSTASSVSIIAYEAMKKRH